MYYILGTTVSVIDISSHFKTTYIICGAPIHNEKKRNFNQKFVFAVVHKHRLLADSWCVGVWKTLGYIYNSVQEREGGGPISLYSCY